METKIYVKIPLFGPKCREVARALSKELGDELLFSATLMNGQRAEAHTLEVDYVSHSKSPHFTITSNDEKGIDIQGACRFLTRAGYSIVNPGFQNPITQSKDWFKRAEYQGAKK